ncbi:hypothetical protein RCL_jg12155.t1 [Rhizophagus clarus]|uniref:Uncharacterized protein n=1 Tax=Rhizophagus clarus TaxID=94130 RepID=A0A8H3KZW3_9GLOM|nr:hypothetical protein RCL_jg12155.t1 [Rhizophagus clarus]
MWEGVYGKQLKLDFLPMNNVKLGYLRVEDEKFNNSVTRLIGMIPAEAIKKKKVCAKSSCKYNRGTDMNCTP